MRGPEETFDLILDAYERRGGHGGASARMPDGSIVDITICSKELSETRQEKLKSLVEDKERLDWLENDMASDRIDLVARYGYDGSKLYSILFASYGAGSSVGFGTIREAIDSARSGK